jgi:hypothetical protein
MKSPDLRAQQAQKKQSLWAPEAKMAVIQSTHFLYSMAEIEEKVRQKISGEYFSNLRKICGIPIQGLHPQKGVEPTVEVKLGDGSTVVGSQVIYADRWSFFEKDRRNSKRVAIHSKTSSVWRISNLF